MIADTKVELCRLYENTSKTGKPYFVGYLGLAKVLMLKNERAAEGEPSWTLFLAERPEKPTPHGYRDRQRIGEDYGRASV